jgi:hypothetical protein
VANLFDTLTRNQRKPRGFKYKPIYFDAEKAEFKAYVEKLRAERDAVDKGLYRPNYKGKFTSQIGKKSGYQKQMLFYNLRLLFILIGLVVGAYYLYNTGLFNTAVNKFLNLFSNKDGLY